MVFFTRYGAWSWVGVAVATLTFGVLVFGIMRLSARTGAGSFAQLCTNVLGGAAGKLFAAMYALLMLITAGAMVSGVGEIAAISMTIPHAYELGLGAAVILGVIWARRGVHALATGGGFLLPVCGLLYLVIAWRGREYVSLQAAHPVVSWLPTLPLAVGYACLNVTLCCGILSEIASRSDAEYHRKTAMWFIPMIGGLLAAANATLMPHIARVEYAPLPMLILARGSIPAALLATATLLIAMMTTLTALIRSLAQLIARLEPNGRFHIPEWAGYLTAALLVVGAGVIGFSRLIGVAYPLMGWGSAVALVGLLVVGKARKTP
jgi:uncharacterized membrane protein YkvI